MGYHGIQLARNEGLLQEVDDTKYQTPKGENGIFSWLPCVRRDTNPIETGQEMTAEVGGTYSRPLLLHFQVHDSSYALPKRLISPNS